MMDKIENSADLQQEEHPKAHENYVVKDIVKNININLNIYLNIKFL